MNKTFMRRSVALCAERTLRGRFTKYGVGITLVAGVLGLDAPAHAILTLTSFTNPHPVVSGGTIGFAYAGDMFVGSVQADGFNVLYSTNLTGGNVQVFAPTISVAPGTAASEHFVASSLGLGGFPNRDIYVAAGSGGIQHINHAGTSGNTFVSGLSGSVRGILFDAVGTFGHDMLVTTNAGNIYRVNSGGTASLLANVGEDVEGLDVAPVGAGFGAFDGQLIVASEGSGTIRAISTTGVVNTVATNVYSAEELTFVPLNLGASGDPVEGFYGANYTQDVLKGDVSQFTGMLGDIIVTGESSHLVNDIHWNGSSFIVTTIGNFPSQPEDGIFVTADIIKGNGPATAVPEPTTAALAFLALTSVAGLALRRRPDNA